MTVEVALVGYGENAERVHAPAIDLNPKTELVAVCDTDERRLARADDQWAVRTVRDARDVVSLEPDCVHVCTPPRTHYDVAETFLSSDVPVLVEKPVVLDLDELASLVEVADDSAAIAGAVHNRLYEAPMQRAVAAVSDGDVGDVVSVTGVRALDVDPSTYDGWVGALAGGKLTETFPHLAYRALAFVSDVAEVTSVTRHWDPEDAGDRQGVTVEARNAAGTQTLTLKLIAGSAPADTLHVHGREGSLEVTETTAALERGGEVTRLFPPESRVQVLVDLAQRWTYRRLGDGHRLNLARGDGRYRLVDAFATAVARGTAPPVPLRDCRGCVLLVDELTSRWDDR